MSSRVYSSSDENNNTYYSSNENNTDCDCGIGSRGRIWLGVLFLIGIIIMFCALC